MNLHIEQYTASCKNEVLKGLVELQKYEVPLTDTRLPATLPQAEAYLRTLLEEIKQKHGVFLCAHIGDGLAGFVVCWIESNSIPNETPDSCIYGYVSDAFVFEKYRRQGIFRELNSALEKHLSTFPQIKRIRINVLANNTQALEAYRRTGYKEYEITLEKKLQ